MKLLVLGVTGILGNAIYEILSETGVYDVYGTARNKPQSKYPDKIIDGIDVNNHFNILEAFSVAKPDVVINCIGLIKQYNSSKDPLEALPINSILPHTLAKLSMAAKARFIHYSTDCVFSGKKGNYKENDVSDCEDLYGKSKFIGEVSYSNSITLRTSLIGHEKNSKRSLLEWFLNEEGSVNGYTEAIFSGLTAYEHAKVLKDYVLPNDKLQGVYNLASNPINKYDLLKLVAKKYNKKINIIPLDKPKIDRSLNGNKFYSESGYNPTSWEIMISEMYNYNQSLNIKESNV